jgi:hypothetical protein
MGRPKGSKNVKSIEFLEELSKHNFNAIQALLWTCHKSKARIEYYEKKVASGEFTPGEDKSAHFLAIYLATVKEITSYVYGKPKSRDEEGKEGTVINVNQLRYGEIQQVLEDAKKHG